MLATQRGFSLVVPAASLSKPMLCIFPADTGQMLVEGGTEHTDASSPFGGLASLSSEALETQTQVWLQGFLNCVKSYCVFCV